MTTYLNDILNLLPVNDEIRLEVDTQKGVYSYLAAPLDMLEGLSATFLAANVKAIFMEDEILHVDCTL